VEPAAPNDEIGDLLAEQIAYYRARACEYDETAPWSVLQGYAELVAALETFAPRGQVLELACGTGQWTAKLAKYASGVTALDSAPEMLAINHANVSQQNVRYVQADLFGWCSSERYDVVFFSAWLSHVPPQRFEEFWALVMDCLNDTGRVFVIDDLPAVAATEQAVEGVGVPTVDRSLRSGARYRTVKVFYEPDELKEQLGKLGWEVQVRPVGWRCFYATAQRARP
jgi:demethylmenaquinone methyltransferase/2-methoxy-6-polyprenyl-1,4-benzoquinol methylase